METQLPYATFVAVICAIGYLITGFTLNPWISLAVGTFLLIGVLLVLNKMNLKNLSKKKAK